MIQIATAPPRQLYFDYSALSTYGECAYRGFLKYEQGWGPREKSAPLHAGSALHVGMYELHMHGDMERALLAMKEEWGDYRPPAISKWAHLTLGHCELVLANYWEDRQRDQVEPLKLKLSDLKQDVILNELATDSEGYVHFAESPLVVQLADDLVYAGKIDLPNKSGSLLYVDDFKCTSQWLTDYWAARYAYSHQMRNYVNMVRAATGLPVAGVRIVGVYMGKEACDEPEKWKRRSSKRSQVFGPYLYSPALLEESKRWAKEQIRFIEWCRSTGAWPMNDRACNFCEFNSVCRTTPPARAGVLAQDFVKRELTGILASGADSDD